MYFHLLPVPFVCKSGTRSLSSSVSRQAAVVASISDFGCGWSDIFSLCVHHFHHRTRLYFLSSHLVNFLKYQRYFQPRKSDPISVISCTSRPLSHSLSTASSLYVSCFGHTTQSLTFIFIFKVCPSPPSAPFRTSALRLQCALESVALPSLPPDYYSFLVPHRDIFLL